MLTMQEIKSHYFFTDEEAAMLRELQPLAEANRERMSTEFYDYLLGIPETAEFLKDDQLRNRLKKTHEDWFVSIFSGQYDNQCLHTLQHIGQVHVRVGLPAHFVNAAMYVVRRFIVEMLQENFPLAEQRRMLRKAADKIVDINLDILSAAYQEEELNKVFLSHRLESKLIHAAQG